MTNSTPLSTSANTGNIFNQNDDTTKNGIKLTACEIKNRTLNTGDNRSPRVAPQCPVDNVTVNENKARIVALFTLLIISTYLFTGYFYLLGLLLGDFLLRTTQQGQNSLLSLLAEYTIRKFNIKNKPTDRAAKRFAAGSGLVFIVLILATALLHFTLIATVLTIIVVIFAALESFVGFCAGCYVYNILKNLKLVTQAQQ